MIDIATLSVSFTAANRDQGASIRKLAERIGEAASILPDHVPGQTITLVVDNAPAGGGQCGVQITSTPYTSAVYTV